MINFLKRENAQIKADKLYLSQNLGEISKEYTDKIAELNRIISGDEASRKLLDAIRSEYEKAQALLKDMHRK